MPKEKEVVPEVVGVNATLSGVKVVYRNRLTDEEHEIAKEEYERMKAEKLADNMIFVREI